MRSTPGSNAEFSAQFITIDDGVLVDPVGLTVDITDPLAAVVVDDAVPVRIDTGYYRYTFAVPPAAPLGNWQITWNGTVAGDPIIGTEIFEVVSSGVAVITGTGDEISERLRWRVGEVSSVPGGSDTLFTDETIRSLLVNANNNIDAATLEGWLYKEAHYASMIDRNEHGSDRRLSQLWDHAHAQVEWWSQVIGEAAVAISAGFRVVGRAMNLGKQEEELQTPFSGYSEHIRVYPMKRFAVPSIMSGEHL